MPPLQVVLPPQEGLPSFAGRAVQLTATIYDFGAVSIALRLAFTDIDWTHYCHEANGLGAWASSSAGRKFWSQLRSEMMAILRPALLRENVEPLEEDYLLSVVHRFQGEEPEGEEDAARRYDREVVARRLVAERPLNFPKRPRRRPAGTETGKEVLRYREDSSPPIRQEPALAAAAAPAVEAERVPTGMGNGERRGEPSRPVERLYQKPVQQLSDDEISLMRERFLRG